MNPIDKLKDEVQQHNDSIKREVIKVDNRAELIKVIKEEINSYGNECDLNHIDVSHLKNLSYVFSDENIKMFNGNISKWDVSKVEYLEGTFKNSNFNGDISNWNVSKVKDMSEMFRGSKFNGDISNWNVGRVERMNRIFSHSIFKGDVSKWDISNVKEMRYIFSNYASHEDLKRWGISKWNIRHINDIESLHSYELYQIEM